MVPRNTSTGGVLEKMVVPALKRGGYEVQTQVNIGKRLGGGNHVADVLADKQGHHYIVSLKWQQTSGTAEQKVPFEVMCLEDAVQTSTGPKYERAYLVLGGNGWSLRDYYISGKMHKHLPHQHVKIMGLEDFVALANSGSL